MSSHQSLWIAFLSFYLIDNILAVRAGASMLPMLNADMQRNLYMLGGIIAKDLELDTLTKCAKAFTARLGRSGTFSQVALLWAGWRGILLRQGIDPGDGPHRDSLVLGKASLTHLEMSRT